MTVTEYPMQLKGPAEQPVHNELQLLTEVLPLAGARVLELGCGAAEKTRQIAERTGAAEIVAAEVDAIQHRKNLSVDDMPNVRFEAFGAEAIVADDASFDVVLMFKSLHHVPGALMGRRNERDRPRVAPGWVGLHFRTGVRWRFQRDHPLVP